MSVHGERLQEAVEIARLSKEHAGDLARNMIRDWVREGARAISRDATAAAFSSLLYDKVELLCKALDTDAVGLARKANNELELRACRGGKQLEIIVDESYGRPYLKFAVRSAQSVRS